MAIFWAATKNRYTCSLVSLTKVLSSTGYERKSQSKSDGRTPKFKLEWRVSSHFVAIPTDFGPGNPAAYYTSVRTKRKVL